MTEIIRHPGGAARKVVKVAEIVVPDLWHIVNDLRKTDSVAANEVLECWHLCHDLLRNIKGETNEGGR